MAEQIAQDPAFAQMSAALQASMVNGGGEAGQSASAPPIDPEQYAQAMSSVLQNPQFMEMAEKLGQQIMTVLCSSFPLVFEDVLQLHCFGRKGGCIERTHEA